MNTAAVVIGVNAYKTRPLTSAINDAKAFREALLKHNLVPTSEIQMFTSPSESGWPEANRKNLNDTLYNFYKNRDDIDQFFFFFSGHGMLTYVKGELRTVLIPVDVEDLDRDAGYLIDFGELRGYMRHGGPREQFYFIDACRDLNPAKDPPTVGALAWTLRDPLTPALAQATLFAVSQLGKARGAVEGMAVMTGDLIKALDGEGLATDYDDQSGWVISMKSIGNYVKDAVEQKLLNEPAYLRAYMRPQLDDPDPKTEPLRFLAKVDNKPLTISIKPESAAGDTKVNLSVRSVPMPEHSLPPKKNHETFMLPPQPYLLEATYLPDSGVKPNPSRKSIDLRKDHEVEITIPLGGPPEPPPPEDPGDGPRAPDILIQGLGAEPAFSVKGEMAVMDYVAAATSAPPGRIIASALESQVAIEVEALQPPYQKWTGYLNLDQEVPTGSYRIRFRLGIDVFNETTLYVKAAQTINVTTTVDAPPLVREALKMSGSLPKQTVISESIGEIQAGVLQTMLPLLGIKPFDMRNEILHEFTGLVEPQDPSDFRMHPFSLVIAIDGNHWGVSPTDILQSVQCRTHVHTHAYESQRDAGFSFTPVETLELRPLSRATLQPGEEVEPIGIGFRRIGLALSSAPAPSFRLELKSPYLGEYGLSCAAIDGRATVVTLAFRPDGSTDISQNILRLPGKDELYAEELMPNVSYGRMVRELQLGQQLYRSGELAPQGLNNLPRIIENLFYAKWTDPILSCMAFLAWQHYRDVHSDESPGFDLELLSKTAVNLHKYFFNLPDSHVIYGLAFREMQSQELNYLLEFDRVPVLAESVRILARYAEETGREDATVVRFARRMSVRQSWASTIRTDEVLAPSVTMSASAASAMTSKAEAEAENKTARSGAAGA